MLNESSRANECGCAKFDIELRIIWWRHLKVMFVFIVLWFVFYLGTFKLVIEFSEEYPNKPPTVRFLSKMFHPNVYADGSICLDILQNRWSPTYDVSSILTSIQSLLDEPNPNSPANSQAAQLYQENKREYEKRVSAIVEQSWNDS